jgi:RimJ/RimL family protein N-acetyltransferase
LTGDAAVPTILETERLLLRTWTLEDTEEALAIYSDPEVMRYIGTGATFRTVEEISPRLLRAMAHQERYGYGFWAVIEMASGRLVGACGIKHLEDGPEVEVGYHFARAAWGKGYATEAAGACLRYAFEQVKLECVVGVVQPANQASRRVLEKIGMTYEGMGHYYGAEAMRFVATRPAPATAVSE